MSVAAEWGSTAAEREAAYPCDEVLPGAEIELFRAVDVAAPVAIVFRWLCQLRAAPYSYDLIDNLGRRSPGELTPGLDELEAGQRVMTIFRLASFERDRHLTAVCRGNRLFGDVAATYLVLPEGTGSRLVVKVLANAPSGRVAGLAYRAGLPWGDLVMMRKQLLTLKGLAERDAAAVSSSRPRRAPRATPASSCGGASAPPS